MKTITVVTPTFNEEENILRAYEEIREIFKSYENYTYTRK